MEIRIMGKPTYNDIINGHQKDLKRIYKLSDRQMEQAVRKHMDGANNAERRNLYQTVFTNKGKE